jgi:uncharacterized Tic20 family protein
VSEYRELAPAAAPPPPPRAFGFMFPLAIVVDGTDVVAMKSRRLYVIRGLLGVFLLPILFGVLAALVEELYPVWFGLAIASVLWGVTLLSMSSWLAKRRMVRFDRSRNVVLAKNGEFPFASLELRVRRLEGISGWTAIELLRGGQVVATIEDRLQAFHTDDVNTHVEYLSRILGDAPVTGTAIATAKKSYLIPDTTAAMLCYLPVQGINLVASFIYIFARERPFVRFAAKQSLTQIGVFLGSVFATGVLLGLPLALARDETIQLVFGIALGLTLVALAIANLVALITACVRASRGRAWVIPWLRPLLKEGKSPPQLDAPQG